jgi:hypothetical protein
MSRLPCHAGRVGWAFARRPPTGIGIWSAGTGAGALRACPNRFEIECTPQFLAARENCVTPEHFSLARTAI